MIDWRAQPIIDVKTFHVRTPLRNLNRRSFSDWVTSPTIMNGLTMQVNVP